MKDDQQSMANILDQNCIWTGEGYEIENSTESHNTLYKRKILSFRENMDSIGMN